MGPVSPSFLNSLRIMGPSLLDSASKFLEKRSGEFEMPLVGPGSVTCFCYGHKTSLLKSCPVAFKRRTSSLVLRLQDLDVFWKETSLGS